MIGFSKHEILGASQVFMDAMGKAVKSADDAGYEVQDYKATYLKFGEDDKIVAAHQATVAEAAYLAANTKADARREQVMLLNMEGMINKWSPNVPPYYAGVSELEQMLRIAENDPSVAAVVIKTDSGGGFVNGTATFSEMISRVNKKKPVLFSVDGIMASAAYWIGASGAGIYSCNKTSFFGSIGTLRVHQDLSQMMDRIGIKTTYITADGNDEKVVGPETEPLSERDLALIKKDLNKLQKEFKNHIRRCRENLVEDERLFSGAVFIASEAKSLGLIDGIEDIEKTVLRAYRLSRADYDKDGKKKKTKAQSEINAENFMSKLSAALADGSVKLGAFLAGAGFHPKDEDPSTPAPVTEANAAGSDDNNDSRILALLERVDQRLSALEASQSVEVEQEPIEDEVEDEPLYEADSQEDVVESDEDIVDDAEDTPPASIEAEAEGEEEGEEEEQADEEEGTYSEEEVEATEESVLAESNVSTDYAKIDYVKMFAELKSSMEEINVKLSVVLAENEELRKENSDLAEELHVAREDAASANKRAENATKNVRKIKKSGSGGARIEKVEAVESDKKREPIFKAGFSSSIKRGTGGNFGSKEWSS